MEREKMRPTQERVWKKEVKVRMKTGMFNQPSATDNIYFKAGFKTGYRLALQHIGNYKAMQYAKEKNIKIANVNPIVNEIINRTSKHFSVSHEQVMSDKRDRGLVIARSVIINLLKELTPYSLANIGQVLAGRDHTTILHHINCKAQKNGLWFPYFEIWNSFHKLKLDLEADFKVNL
jgi:hypothetical protein